jgi:3-keto-L-gulonate-6-phosphate decarboxylase
MRNKSAVLQRVRAATPHDGFVPGLAHIVGLDAALERAEERTYDAIVEIMNSEEVDRAIRDIINSSFSRMRDELARKSWQEHLGIRNKRVK